MDTKKHWETVYETKNPDQVSWTQAVPKTSLAFIASFGVKKDAHIIRLVARGIIKGSKRLFYTPSTIFLATRKLYIELYISKASL